MLDGHLKYLLQLLNNTMILKSSTEPDPRRPNLIYVFADQLRLQSCGYAGATGAITPCIDGFAAEAVNFPNFVANTPVCAAYRASLVTGKHTTSHGMVINEIRLSPHQRCLGHVLTEAGYATGYIGKWHLWADELGHHDDPKNSFVPPGPHRLGFDGEWKAYNFHHDNYGTYYHADTPERMLYGEGTYEPEAQTGFAIDFVQRHAPGEEPFALFLSWGPPHDPWGPGNVPTRFWEMFEGMPFPAPPNYRPQNDEPYCDDWSRLSDTERAQLESWRRGYYAQTTSIDECFGRLLEAVEAAGVAENTVVIFTSDHGEMMGAQGRRAKNIFYEEACRVPFLMRWPGYIPAASTSDACLSTVDVMPTLLGLVNLPIPESVEGADLSHCVLGKPGPEPAAAFLQGCGAVAAWEDGHEWRALRDKRFTYAVYRVDGRELLFDNLADPHQTNDLVSQASHVSTLKYFQNMLREKMAGLNDTFEACTWYRDHWTDGQRHILRAAKGPFDSEPT